MSPSVALAAGKLENSTVVHRTAMGNGRCMTLYVPPVAKKRRYLSNLEMDAPSTAATATPRSDEKLVCRIGLTLKIRRRG